MPCLFRHRWTNTVDGPYEVGAGFAWAFGNGWLVRTCSRCGKVKRVPMCIL
jgi:hypothetical protein